MARAFNIPEGALQGTIYDPENPDSLINIIPDRMKPVLLRIKDKMPRVLYCTESELRTYISPDERDERVRLAFWDEYNHSTHLGKKMSLAAFLHGTMSWEAWVTVYEPSDKKMMWVFCPPVSYATAMRNILHRGTERLMEIMNMPIVDENGKTDSKMIVNILRAFQLVDLRVKGAVAQKLHIQQQSMNVNHNINQDSPNVVTGQPLEALQLEDLEKLEKRIESARRDAKRLVKELPPEDKQKYLADMVDPAAFKHGDQLRKAEYQDFDEDITLTIDSNGPSHE